MAFEKKRNDCFQMFLVNSSMFKWLGHRFRANFEFCFACICRSFCRRVIYILNNFLWRYKLVSQ